MISLYFIEHEISTPFSKIKIGKIQENVINSTYYYYFTI